MDEWTSIKDGPPQDDKEVLIFAKCKHDDESIIEKSKYCNISLFPRTTVHMGWLEPFQYFFADYEITHWMPLPKPPKED